MYTGDSDIASQTLTEVNPVPNKDLRMSIILMVIFIILFGLSFTFQSSNVVTSHTTASFFPQVVLIVAMFFTAIMIYQSIRNGPDTDNNKQVDKEALKRVLLSMVSAIAFGIGVPYLGTLVSISLFIIAIMLTWGVRKKSTMILTALITPVLIYFIFNKLLYVQLPSGILI